MPNSDAVDRSCGSGRPARSSTEASGPRSADTGISFPIRADSAATVESDLNGNEPVMAPIGEGNLDWDELLPALDKSGTRWIAVEQDQCYRDPFDCLKSSFEFLKNHPALNG